MIRHYSGRRLASRELLRKPFEWTALVLAASFACLPGGSVGLASWAFSRSKAHTPGRTAPSDCEKKTEF